MSDALAFTDLEAGLYGPDGTQVLRQTASRLIALRDKIAVQSAAGLTPPQALEAKAVLDAVAAAERIIIVFSSSRH